jgi:hypothetical protein
MLAKLTHTYFGGILSALTVIRGFTRNKIRVTVVIL